MGNWLCPITGREHAKEKIRELLHGRTQQLDFEIRLQENMKQGANRKLADITRNVHAARRHPTDDELLAAKRLLHQVKVCERNIANYEKSLLAIQALESTYLQAYDNMDDHKLSQELRAHARELNIDLGELQNTIEDKQALHEDLETMNEHMNESRAEAMETLQLETSDLHAEVSQLFKARPDDTQWQFRGVVPTRNAPPSMLYSTGYDDEKQARDRRAVTNQDFEAHHNSVFADRLGLAPSSRGASKTRKRNGYMDRLLQPASTASEHYSSESDDEEYSRRDRLVHIAALY